MYDYIVCIFIWEYILTAFYAELVGDGERVAKFLYIEHTFLFDL